MEKNNASYETLFVVYLTPGDEAVKSVIEKFTALIADNGAITEVNEWGKRKLAYPINDMNEGYYVLVKFTAPTAFPAELERVFSITDGIMRFIVVAQEA